MNHTDHSTNKTSSIMLFMFWLVLLGIATFGFYQYDKKQKTPTTHYQDGETRVVLKSGQYGHFVAYGRINDVEVKFLLDTGASQISIPETIAQKARLKKGQYIQSSTANGIINVNLTSIDSVKLGEIEIKNVSGTINPYMHDDEVLLGMTFLKKLKWEQSNGRLTLIQ